MSQEIQMQIKKSNYFHFYAIEIWHILIHRISINDSLNKSLSALQRFESVEIIGWEKKGSIWLGLPVLLPMGKQEELETRNASVFVWVCVSCTVIWL